MEKTEDGYDKALKFFKSHGKVLKAAKIIVILMSLMFVCYFVLRTTAAVIALN